jgi:hypothetical protein
MPVVETNRAGITTFTPKAAVVNVTGIPLFAKVPVIFRVMLL